MDAGDIKSGKAHPRTWFAAPTAEDLGREEEVAAYVERHLAEWQDSGIVPDMAIEPGYNTSQPIRERGWTHWHHLFNPRHLLVNAVAARHAKPVAHMCFGFGSMLNRQARLAIWNITAEKTEQVFSNQALNTNYNFPARGWDNCSGLMEITKIGGRAEFTQAVSQIASYINVEQDLIVTDPPYADAVQYDEITEFFIAWLRKNPPAPFNEWVWDSRRALAIKGEGQSFKAGMVEAYRAMTNHLVDNGLQIVQFTHQDVKTFSDMAQIFWGAGLQVVQDWYVSTETMNGLKVGGYVQGTHMIILRKRGEPLSGYSDEIQEEIRVAVAEQVADMVGLNQRAAGQRRDGNIFNDADLQMAGYAAALRVLTGYTRIDGTDMTREALRPRKKGEVTLVDEMMEFAVRVANEHLIPDGIERAVWLDLSGAERFFLRMTDMEVAGQVRLDDYQNFAKAFRVDDYTALMGSLTPNAARLKTPAEMGKKHLADEVEFGGRSLVRIGLHAVWKIERGEEVDLVLEQLRDAIPDYYRKRGTLLALIAWLGERWRTQDGGHLVAARVLAEALRVEKI
jgi:adenine-specific DNA methylase